MSKRETSNLPISYEEQIQKELANITSKVGGGGHNRIRAKGNMSFSLPDDSEATKLTVVILDFTSSNMFYDSAYDPQNSQPPACFAIGDSPSTLVPSENSPDKQSDTCAPCPMNQFGSSGKGKACKNTRQVAVIPAPDPEDSEWGDAPVWLLSVPPTSCREFDAYVRTLATRNTTIPAAVVTEIYFADKKVYFSPRFKSIRPLTPEELSVVMPRRNEAKELLTAEPDVSGYKSDG